MDKTITLSREEIEDIRHAVLLASSTYLKSALRDERKNGKVTEFSISALKLRDSYNNLYDRFKALSN